MYVQVYTTLREWIYEGLYAPGAKLPAESEISAMFGVSRITIRGGARDPFAAAFRVIERGASIPRAFDALIA